MSTPTPVQNALTALIPLKPGEADDLRNKLIMYPVVSAGLDAVGTVHFARIFVFQPGNPANIPENIAAIITTYDGSFKAYIDDFVSKPLVAAFFDDFLGKVVDEDAKDLIPVIEHPEGFADFIQKYDVTNPANKWGQWYSAYPTKTVQNILHPSTP